MLFLIFSLSANVVLELFQTKDDDLVKIPETTQLFDAYPNPFNPQTTIQYNVDKDGPVSLKIYDIIGKKVADFSSDYCSAGEYRILWDASALPSGGYFIVMQSQSVVLMKKAILLK